MSDADRFRELLAALPPQVAGDYKMIEVREGTAARWLALLEAVKAKRRSPNHPPLCVCGVCEDFDNAIKALEAPCPTN
jgi:hypothetical protein